MELCSLRFWAYETVERSGTTQCDCVNNLSVQYLASWQSGVIEVNLFLLAFLAVCRRFLLRVLFRS
jgi:hypothetical protein